MKTGALLKANALSSIANCRWISWLVLLLVVASSAGQQEVDPNRFDSNPSSAQMQRRVLHPKPVSSLKKRAARKHAAGRSKAYVTAASVRSRGMSEAKGNVAATKGETK